MIRFLIETTSSKSDMYGNRYHFATITSTKTGLDLRVKSIGGESNARALVRKNTDAEWSEIHATESTLPIREFNRAAKFHENGATVRPALYEHQITPAHFVAIETE